MNENFVRKVAIVGGGTAGWMTAIALAKYLIPQGGSVTLVESEEIGPVGVGEATIPPIAMFNRQFGIDEDTFVKATQGTFKLGIEFVNWGAIGERYFHPFGAYGFDIGGLDFHHYWMRNKEFGEMHDLNTYSLSAQAAYAGKFIRPEPAHGPVIERLAYAFHFDSILYGQFLRTLCIQQGVNRIEGKVEHVELSGETGFIDHLTLDGDRTIEADLFIDCTGFRGVLISQALGVGYDDWSAHLPMNRAVAAPCVRDNPPEPYTRATAHKAGWQWRIPLQHRLGNGLVYCDEYMSQDEAEETLRGNLEGELLAEPRHLRFQTGKRNRLWAKNCVAIGLSAGFLEPLESTSIHLIQSGISKLLTLFPDAGMSATDIDEYNRIMAAEYEYIRDFLILHYSMTQRDDSPLWNYVREMPLPASLQRKLGLLKSRGRFFRYEQELFSLTSWLAVSLGQGMELEGYNPIAGHLGDRDLQNSLANMRRSIEKAAAALPTHQAFIDRFCKAEDVYAHQSVRGQGVHV